MKHGSPVAAITKELKAYADAKYRETLQGFFREPIQAYGVRTPDWRRVNRQFWVRVKDLPKARVLELCEELLAVGNGEERGFAFDWAFRLRGQLVPGDFQRLERWLKTHVSNWGACDALCGGVLGHFLLDHPRFVSRAKQWAKSKNRWLRRAAAVALIVPNRQGRYLPEAFEVAELLLEDGDDMVRKGYGWMLKEIANREQRRVFEFVMARRDRMPRTALRYAIEKMPAGLKRRAMARP